MADTIPNLLLTGTELKQIIQSDVERMLNMDALLMEYMSYGNVTYIVTVKLLLNNPAFPEHMITIKAKPNKDKTVVTPPVKDVSADAVRVGRQRTRTINNPNLERLKHGLPINQTFIDPSDGKQKTQALKYTAEDAGLTAADINSDNGTVDKELQQMEIDL